MATVTDIERTRVRNLRRNLRRIFDSWAVQTRIASDAGIHPVHLAKILNGTARNPGINTIEAISIALEIPVETLLSVEPPDIDLRISKENPEKSAGPS